MKPSERRDDLDESLTIQDRSFATDVIGGDSQQPVKLDGTWSALWVPGS